MYGKGSKSVKLHLSRWMILFIRYRVLLSKFLQRCARIYPTYFALQNFEFRCWWVMARPQVKYAEFVVGVARFCSLSCRWYQNTFEGLFARLRAHPNTISYNNGQRSLHLECTRLFYRNHSSQDSIPLALTIKCLAGLDQKDFMIPIIAEVPSDFFGSPDELGCQSRYSCPFRLEGLR